ncbi:capsular polysaccharide export protein, LipB/KpsS family [Aeromonas veronii]|uniref:capsular polysaccharide export protein, LipB/KpsS family n=1 Tax=Aeromonas veronii TaxID=654 RepID=UPI003F79FED9
MNFYEFKRKVSPSSELSEHERLSLYNKFVDKYPFLGLFKPAFELSLELNDTKLIKFYLSKILIYFPTTLFSCKATIEAIIASNEITEKHNLLDKAFVRLITSGKENNYISLTLKKILNLYPNRDFKVLANYYLHINPSDTRILTLLGDLAKQDGNVSLAESYYNILASYQNHYAKAKLISLYSDFGELKKGAEMISHLIMEKMTYQNKKRILPMLLRVCQQYPNQKEKIFTLRDEFSREIISKGDNTSCDDIRLLIKLRHIPSLINYRQVNDSDLRRHLNTIIGDLGDVIRIAYENDRAIDEHMAIKNGQVFPLEKSQITNDNVVELFIPTVFFSMDDTKEIYKTIRAGYGKIISVLTKSDYIILPRMQYNWRYVDNMSSSNVCCYHTLLEEGASGLVVQESTIPGRISIDHNGYAGFSSFSNVFSFQPIDKIKKASIDKFILNFREAKESKYAQREGVSNLSEGRGYILFPLQVQTDSVAKLRYFDIEDALIETIDFAKEQNLCVYIKRHPYCKSESISDLINGLTVDDNVYLTDDCIHSLIENAEFVITANSGTGLEALMYGKPVITFGKSDYGFAALESKTMDEFKSNLVVARKTKGKLNYDFLYSYLYDYTCSAFSEEEISKLVFNKITPQITN